MQEMRTRFEASKSQHSEMLQRAQAICLEADEKADVMGKRADKAESRAAKAETELAETKSDGRQLASDLKVGPCPLTRVIPLLPDFDEPHPNPPPSTDHRGSGWTLQSMIPAIPSRGCAWEE